MQLPIHFEGPAPLADGTEPDATKLCGVQPQSAVLVPSKPERISAMPHALRCVLIGERQCITEQLSVRFMGRPRPDFAGRCDI